MVWLSSYHAVLDFHAKTVTLAMPEFPRLEWRGSSISRSRRVISFLKARHMFETCCLAYLAYVRDTAVETPTIDSVLVVREFSNIFPSHVPGMPPDHDIDFSIDMVPSTELISISLYHIAPKELNEHLEELLEKGFIRLSVSLWGAPILFVKKKDACGGIKVDPRKIEAVQSYPHPTTTTEIKSFMGLVGYYRQFVEGFSSIATSLTRLTQKGAASRWSDDCKRDLNLRQQRWLELLKDYDITILYHPGKANVIVDALRRKTESMGSFTFISAEERSLALDIQSIANKLVRLALPPSPSGVRLVFHVSVRRKYHAKRSHVLNYSTVQLDESLGYEEEPVSIVSRKVHQLRSKKILVVKVQ
ncbi:uncharacterized protein [Nicotiana sylvestris]|uniref:uncharacterized protein n=1 Tax=Nicotiana sylvestris TaxID=4096 RepID=UPI00388C606A